MSHVVQMIPGINRLGGAEQQALMLSVGLAQRGWKVTLVALSGDGGEAKRELAAAGVDFFTLGMRKGLADPRGWMRLLAWLRRNTPDVIHAHLPHAVWMARLARVCAPVRAVVNTVHTQAAGSAMQRFLHRATEPFADCLTAVSRGVSDACLAAGMSAVRPAVVLPNGVDVNAWQPDPAAGTRLRQEKKVDGKFLWFAAGRLEPVKNYAALLEAFAGLPQEARLVIAGAGSLADELRTLSGRLSLDSRVQFLGFSTEVRQWMQAADGFVLASRWEGLPMTLLEAGACGLACVATDVAGSNEVILDGETGFLARKPDAALLRRAMLRLMQMAPATRRALGMNARQRVVQEYSLDSVLDRWETLYSGLLAERILPARRGRFQGTIVDATHKKRSQQQFSRKKHLPGDLPR